MSHSKLNQKSPIKRTLSNIKSSDMSRSLSARSNSFGVVPSIDTPTPLKINKSASFIPFMNLQFSKSPHIIVDTSCFEVISESTPLEFPILTHSLSNALVYHQSGWTIQIQRDRFDNGIIIFIFIALRSL